MSVTSPIFIPLDNLKLLYNRKTWTVEYSSSLHSLESGFLGFFFWVCDCLGFFSHFFFLSFILLRVEFFWGPFSNFWASWITGSINLVMFSVIYNSEVAVQIAVTKLCFSKLCCVWHRHWHHNLIVPLFCSSGNCFADNQKKKNQSKSTVLLPKTES